MSSQSYYYEGTSSVNGGNFASGQLAKGDQGSLNRVYILFLIIYKEVTRQLKVAILRIIFCVEKGTYQSVKKEFVRNKQLQNTIIILYFIVKGDHEQKDGSLDRHSLNDQTYHQVMNGLNITTGIGNVAIQLTKSISENYEYKSSFKSNQPVLTNEQIDEAFEDSDNEHENSQSEISNANKPKEFIIKRLQKNPSYKQIRQNTKGSQQINIYNINQVNDDGYSQQNQQNQFRMSQQKWVNQNRQFSKRQQFRNQQNFKENQLSNGSTDGSQLQALPQHPPQRIAHQTYYSSSNRNQNPYQVYPTQHQQTNKIFKKNPYPNTDTQFPSSNNKNNLPDNSKVTRNTVYGVPFLDQQKQSFVLGNHDYEQINRLGSRASTMKPYQIHQQIPISSINTQFTQQSQRPSESQQKQRTKLQRFSSAIEERRESHNQMDRNQSNDDMEINETNGNNTVTAATNLKMKIHQSQSSQNFPQPRALQNFQQINNNNNINIINSQQSINLNGSQNNEYNFRISINKEEKVVNHLTKDVNPNLNLMFYDFNDYGQSQPGQKQSQQQTQAQTAGDRLPSRQNITRNSRRGPRESQTKFFDQIQQVSTDMNPRLGSPFPNFQKRTKVILPSLSQQQNQQIVNNGLSAQSPNNNSHNNKNQNVHHSPMRTTSIGLVMEMIHEEDN